MQSPLVLLLGNNTTKAAILEAIAESPSTVKGTYYQIKNKTPKPITYQAVHKAMKEMINAEILVKRSDKKITINKIWVYRLEDLAKQLRSTSENVNEIVTVYTYDNFSKFVSAIIKLVHDAPNEKNLPGVCITKHAWPPLGLTKQDYDLLTVILKETKYYDITTIKTPLAEAFAKTLQQMGKNVKVGSKLANQLDFICKGDHIFEVVFDKDFLENVNRIFFKYKILGDEAINDILKNIVTKPTQIKIIHTLSPKYAEGLRKMILDEFDTKGTSDKGNYTID